MKSKIYQLFIAFLVFGFMVSCTEEWGTLPGNDPAPVVTIFSYNAPADKDPDATANLRFAPNSQCDKFYVLIELKTDKEAFMATHDEAAYAERVVSNGTQYPAQSVDLLNDALANVYAITAVGVTANGTKGKPSEFVFNGIIWELIGTAYYTDERTSWSYTTVAAPTHIPAKWYKSTNQPELRYKLVAILPSWNNYEQVIKLNWDATTGGLKFFNGQVSPANGYWDLPTPFVHPTYGAMWTEVDLSPDYTGYDPDDNSIYMDTRMRVSAGVFNTWRGIYIELPPLPW